MHLLLDRMISPKAGCKPLNSVTLGDISSRGEDLLLELSPNCPLDLEIISELISLNAALAYRDKRLALAGLQLRDQILLKALYLRQYLRGFESVREAAQFLGVHSAGQDHD